MDLTSLKIVDGVVEEPPGGAHRHAERVIEAVGDAVEAALNGQVTPYDPSGGITSVGATLGASYNWSEQWSTTAYVTYKHLVGDAADSPIVKQFGSENQVGVGLTVSYSFGFGG